MSRTHQTGTPSTTLLNNQVTPKRGLFKRSNTG
uniref:Uncharacterized protein n=1 Tax=Anguilla anguilla TaxID=7936 RepID=A0A0E9QR82_ANGAN